MIHICMHNVYCMYIIYTHMRIFMRLHIHISSLIWNDDIIVKTNSPLGWIQIWWRMACWVLVIRKGWKSSEMDSEWWDANGRVKSVKEVQQMGFFRWAKIVGMGSRWIPSKIFFSLNILLMEEIPNNHLGCIKPRKYWEKTTYQLVQDFFINSIPLQNICDAKSGFLLLDLIPLMNWLSIMII